MLLNILLTKTDTLITNAVCEELEPGCISSPHSHPLLMLLCHVLEQRLL